MGLVRLLRRVPSICEFFEQDEGSYSPGSLYTFMAILAIMFGDWCQFRFPGAKLVTIFGGYALSYKNNFEF